MTCNVHSQRCVSDYENTRGVTIRYPQAGGVDCSTSEPWTPPRLYAGTPPRSDCYRCDTSTRRSHACLSPPHPQTHYFLRKSRETLQQQDRTRRRWLRTWVEHHPHSTQLLLPGPPHYQQQHHSASRELSGCLTAHTSGAGTYQTRAA